MTQETGIVVPPARPGVRRRRRRSAGRFVARLGGLATALLRVAFAALVALALLFYGSVETWPLTITTAAMGALAGLAILLAGEPGPTRVLYRAALAGGLAFVGFALLQSAPLPGGFLAHPLWAEAEALLGPVRATISLAPAFGPLSLLWATMPLAAFVAALVLHPDDRTALRLLAVLGWIGALFAAVAIAQAAIAPDRLLFEPKAHYIGSLTAPFVNRNTAATFYGVSALVLAGLAVGGLGRREARVGIPGIPAPAAVHAALALVCAVALLLTHSRGGLVAAVAGFLVLGPVLAAGSRSGRSRPALRRLAVPALTVVAVALFVGLFAGRTGLRIAEAGLEDQRFCMLPSLLAAAADRPWLGSGLGTFADAFAAFRDPACGTFGVWFRAHDSYLEGVITLGLPVTVTLAAAAVVLGLVFVRGCRVRRRTRHAPAIGLAVLVLVAVHALVDFSLQIPGFAAFAAAVLAAAATVALGRPLPAGTNLPNQ